jgi:hypothetical protein
MDIKQLIAENDRFEFPIRADALATIIESQKSLRAAAQFMQPVLSEYLRAQRDIGQIAQELDSAWHNRFLLEASNAAEESFRYVAENPLKYFHEIEKINGSVRASLDTISLVSSFSRQDTLTQICMESLKLSELAHSSAAISAEVIQIHKVFLPTFDAFSAVRDELFQKKDYFSELRIPAREHYLTTDLLHELTVTEKSSEFTHQRTVAIKELDEQLMITLPEALSELNPSLYLLWQGAWGSLVSRNPDRIRHTLVSARELVTHVLHALSPDDKIKAWSKSNEHYHNGRPTRKARLLFIHDGINDPAMKDYFQKENDACLSLIDLFQRTHDITPEFNDTHLQVMLRRVHFMICTWVQIHKAKTN